MENGKITMEDLDKRLDEKLGDIVETTIAKALKTDDNVTSLSEAG